MNELFPSDQLTDSEIEAMRHMRDRAKDNHQYFGKDTVLGRHWGKAAALMTLLILHETGVL